MRDGTVMNEAQRRAPAWLLGIAYLPFGLYVGFLIYAMQFLLTARGLRVEDIALLQLVALLPSWTSFLVTPLTDCGMSRRRWAFVLAVIAAAGLGSSVLLLDAAAHGHPKAFAAVVFVGAFAAQMYCSVLGGMTPNLIAEKDLGAVSGWLNVANLGCTPLGGTLSIVMVTKLPTAGAAAGMALMIFVPCLLLLGTPREIRTPRGFAEAARTFVGELIAVSRTRAMLMGMLIFITPAASFAAQNLFTGIGRDFHATDGQLTYLVGLMQFVPLSVGALLGGKLCNVVDRRMLYVGAGCVGAMAALGMAFGPRTAGMFIAGVSFYNLMQGINYAGASAVAFDVMGPNNPLSATMYSVLMAATNVAISTVIWGDSRAYEHFGVRGCLLTDAAFSLFTGSVMLAVLARWGGTGREHLRTALADESLRA